MKRILLGAIFIILFFVLLGLLAPPTQEVPPDALTMMQTVFEGGHTKAEITQQLDQAMQLYNFPITEDNYSRAGSVLVALRKDTGIHEMVTLDYMIRSYTPGMNFSFGEAAALSVTFLQMGDR